jgi:hypothetical protein
MILATLSRVWPQDLAPLQGPNPEPALTESDLRIIEQAAASTDGQLLRPTEVDRKAEIAWWVNLRRNVWCLASDEAHAEMLESLQ